MAASALSNTRMTSVCAWTWVRGQCSGDRHCARISPGLRLRRLHSSLLRRCLVVALLDLPRERTSTHTKSVWPFLTKSVLHATSTRSHVHVHTSTLHLHATLCFDATAPCQTTSCPPRSMAQTSEIDGSNLRDRWLKPPRSMAQSAIASSSTAAFETSASTDLEERTSEVRPSGIAGATA